MSEVLAVINHLFSWLSYMIGQFMSAGLFGQAFVLGPVLAFVIRVLFKGILGTFQSKSPRDYISKHQGRE